MSEELAFDLGTGSTRVADRDGVVVVEEPTVAAVDDDSGRLLAFGSAAVGLASSSAGRVVLVRPVRSGQLVDPDLAELVVADALRLAGVTRMSHPRVLATSYVGATPVQLRALERALRRGGARSVRFIDAPTACAIACDLPIDEPTGSMVIDVGAGRSDIALLALGGLVAAKSEPLGGDDFELAARHLLARRHGLVVDRSTARELVRCFGSVDIAPDPARAAIIGRSASSGEVLEVVVSRAELGDAFEEIVRPILSSAVDALCEAPPDVANDVLRSGAILGGGVATLHGLERRLAEAIGVPVHVPPEGGRLAVLGAARCVAEIDVTAAPLTVARRR